jgi:hypothetical protein
MSKWFFLNGNLTKDVYMTQPEGFVDPKHAGKICKLQKSIYGLKQASRNLNLRFDEVVKGFGFIKNVNNLVFTRRLVGAQLYFWSFMWLTYY